jgi:transposase-like protein
VFPNPCEAYQWIDGKRCAAPARLPRIEVISGVGGGRRRWRLDGEARIVMENLEEGAVVAEGAHRHWLRPQQLFDCRRQFRQG